MRYMAYHNKLGKLGEDEAVSMLEEKGFDILDRNWRNGKNEIDIVAQIEKFIVFVEVKTRNSSLDQIDELISPSKERNFLNAVNAYLETVDTDLDCRLDIVLVKKKLEGFDVIHIEDAITQA